MKSTEQLAQEFSELWIERWNEIPKEEKGMRLSQGRVFLEDLNGDQMPELFVVTSEGKDAEEETKYFESTNDDTEITPSEYNQRREAAEKNGKLVKEITVSGKDIEFLIEDNLQAYVLSLLNQGQ